jgi:hypothetical protein
VTRELEIAEVQEVSTISEPANWPDCLCCRELLVLCENLDHSNMQALCRCGIWTSTVEMSQETDQFDVGLLLIIRVFHPWGMSATGRTFFDAVKRVYL